MNICYLKEQKQGLQEQIAEEFDRIGGNINAFTSKENTCYYAKVLDHHAYYAVEVLADMFFNSLFDSIEIGERKTSCIRRN